MIVSSRTSGAIGSSAVALSVTLVVNRINASVLICETVVAARIRTVCDSIPSICRPFALIAATCSGRPMRRTSWAAASFAP